MGTKSLLRHLGVTVRQCGLADGLQAKDEREQTQADRALPARIAPPDNESATCSAEAKGVGVTSHEDVVKA